MEATPSEPTMARGGGRCCCVQSPDRNNEAPNKSTHLRAGEPPLLGMPQSVNKEECPGGHCGASKWPSYCQTNHMFTDCKTLDFRQVTTAIDSCWGRGRPRLGSTSSCQVNACVYHGWGSMVLTRLRQTLLGTLCEIFPTNL